MSVMGFATAPMLLTTDQSVKSFMLCIESFSPMYKPAIFTSYN